MSTLVTYATQNISAGISPAEIASSSMIGNLQAVSNTPAEYTLTENAQPTASLRKENIDNISINELVFDSNEQPKKSIFAAAFDSLIEKTASENKPVHCTDTLDSGDRGIAENFQKNAEKVRNLLNEANREKFDALLKDEKKCIDNECALEYFLTSLSLFSKETLTSYASNLNNRVKELYKLSKVEKKYCSTYSEMDDAFKNNLNKDLKTYLDSDKNPLEKKLTDFIDKEVFNKSHKEHISWLKNNKEKIFNGGGPYIMNAIQKRLNDFSNHNLLKEITGMIAESFVLRDILNVNSDKKINNDDNGDAKGPRSADNEKTPLIYGHGNHSSIGNVSGILTIGNGNKNYTINVGRIKPKPTQRSNNQVISKNINSHRHGIVASVEPATEIKDKIISIEKKLPENPALIPDDTIPQSWIYTASPQLQLKTPEQIVSIKKSSSSPLKRQVVQPQHVTRIRSENISEAAGPIKKEILDVANMPIAEIEKYVHGLSENYRKVIVIALLEAGEIDETSDLMKYIPEYLFTPDFNQAVNVKPDQKINVKPITKSVTLSEYADEAQTLAVRLRANSVF